MKIFPESVLTPDKILQKLSQFYEEMHLIHLNTTSYAQHKALDGYEDLVSYKDKISELLLGYYAPNRFKGYSLTINLKDPLKLCEEICIFAHDLENFANSNKFSDLSNIAQEIEGFGAKLTYLLTLK